MDCVGVGPESRVRGPEGLASLAIGAEREVRVTMQADGDIVVARQQGRVVAQRTGLDGVDLTIVATVISELARNILRYAGRGHIDVTAVARGRRTGVMVVASDRGPGIADLDIALLDGYSSSGSLGLGLPGVRRLVDEFEITSIPGEGTTVRAVKWC